MVLGPAQPDPLRRGDEFLEDDAAMNDQTNDAESGSEGAALPAAPGPVAPPPPRDPGSPQQPPPSRRRRTLIILGGVLAAVLALAGIGLAAAMYALRGSGERLSTTIPADVH